MTSTVIKVGVETELHANNVDVNFIFVDIKTIYTCMYVLSTSKLQLY